MVRIPSLLDFSPLNYLSIRPFVILANQPQIIRANLPKVLGSKLYPIRTTKMYDVNATLDEILENDPLKRIEASNRQRREVHPGPQCDSAEATAP